MVEQRIPNPRVVGSSPTRPAKFLNVERDMENQRQKWVNLVFTAVAIMIAAIAFVGLSKISAVYNFESSFKQIDLAIRFGSIGLGVIAGLVLYLKQESNAFMNE